MRRALLQCILALLCVPGAAYTQDSAKVERDSWLVAVSAGIPGYGQEAIPELFTVGMNATYVRSFIGPDISVGVAPYGIARGLVAFGARAGIAAPIHATRYFILAPSAGFSILGFGDRGNGDVTGGWNAGVAAMILAEDDKTTGFRVGMTWHYFQSTGPAIWLFETGVLLRTR